MRRRDFLTLAGASAAASPFEARAQQAATGQLAFKRVGLMFSTPGTHKQE